MGAGEPYRSLRNVLNYYGSLFGVRGVIWHQGEADNNKGTSRTVYKDSLNAVIDATRNHFNTNLPWAISNVSFNGSFDNPPIRSAQDNSRSNKQGANGAINSDSYTGGPFRQVANGDKVHFDITGLNFLADNYNANLNTLYSKAPVMANSIVPVNFTQSGGSKILSLNFGAIGKQASDFNCFFWTTGGDYTAIQYPNYNCTSSDTHTKAITSNGTWICYMRDNLGNVYTTGKLYVSTNANARIAASEIVSKVFPNPTYEGFENTIEFELLEPSTVKLEIIKESGEVLHLLTDGTHDKGRFEYPFTLKSKNLKEVETFYYRITINDVSDTKRIILSL